MPITPATFGPIACISKKFVGSDSEPTFCDTLAAIGTADTPAEPIRGLILPFVTLHITLPITTPAAVPNANATRPRITILIVFIFKKASALVVAPTLVPSNITTIYISAFDAVSVSCLTTPHSLNKLPSISIPTSGAVVGKIRTTTTVIIIGNKIFSNLETGLNCSILILRSFSVVSNFIIGGWIIGTNDIYEYAATAIGPIKAVWPNLPARKIDVGPSAPPMIEIAAAALSLNPINIARK